MASKYNIEIVKQIFSNASCTCLETEYKNNKYPMRYICSCGEESKIALTNFIRGRKCWKCGSQKQSNNKIWSQERASEEFEKYGCKLIGEYKGNNTPVEFQCKCGEISKISLSNLQKDCLCRKCANKKISINTSGSNNWRWNPDRDKVRSIARLHDLSKSAKTKFRKLHNITDSNLHVDHIFPIKCFVEHNIYDLEIINHESNLQILDSKTNISKNDTYNSQQFLKWLNLVFI